MDIQAGEYARDEKGFITKIDSDYVLENIERFIKGHRIVKHSKNIIDLIEVGDYVNGYRAEAVSIPTNMVLLEHNGFDWHGLKAKDTLVTKEQFESIEYRLEA